jgi:4-hydroxy-4-methyl-2-oxoglutarate aldolase
MTDDPSNRADQDEAAGRVRRLPVTTISDALDRLGIAGHCLGIKPLDHRFTLCGRALPMRTIPIGVARGTVGDYIDDVGAGDVIVIDNGGRPDATVWGDILTFVAHAKGVAGTVIDGHCRDISRSIELGYPIYSRGWSMRTGKDRVQLDGFNVPVSIGDARVNPGDLMTGDANGVVVIPRERESAVIALAEQIHAAEEEICRAVESGMRLDEARTKFKYFELQRREGDAE